MLHFKVTETAMWKNIVRSSKFISLVTKGKESYAAIHGNPHETFTSFHGKLWWYICGAGTEMSKFTRSSRRLQASKHPKPAKPRALISYNVLWYHALAQAPVKKPCPVYKYTGKFFMLILCDLRTVYNCVADTINASLTFQYLVSI